MKPHGGHSLRTSRCNEWLDEKRKNAFATVRLRESGPRTCLWKRRLCSAISSAIPQIQRGIMWMPLGSSGLVQLGQRPTHQMNKKAARERAAYLFVEAPTVLGDILDLGLGLGPGLGLDWLRARCATSSMGRRSQSALLPGTTRPAVQTEDGGGSEWGLVHRFRETHHIHHMGRIHIFRREF
jgi:hypothetical protein